MLVSNLIPITQPISDTSAWLAMITAGFGPLKANTSNQAGHLEDEEHISTWSSYIAAASKNDQVVEVLGDRLPQLRFPIEAGISQSESYQLATRAGYPIPRVKGGLVLEQPQALRLSLQVGFAGSLPIIEAGTRCDFESLVQAFFFKNEPVSIPPSMGACLITGYYNWDRWVTGMESTRDTFVLLNPGPYSDVPAQNLNLSDELWQRHSLCIRRQHEYAHYATYRFFGRARRHLLDEIVADYMGIVAADGSFKLDWFLAAMGLEDYPTYRAGGRFENYASEWIRTPELYSNLMSLVVQAGRNLARFDAFWAERLHAYPDSRLAFFTLTNLTLAQLGDLDGLTHLAQALACAESWMNGSVETTSSDPHLKK